MNRQRNTTNHQREHQACGWAKIRRITVLGGALSVVVIVLAVAIRTSLGNLAATVLILLLRPFNLGDLIQTGGALGVVHEIQMLNAIETSKGVQS